MDAHDVVPKAEFEGDREKRPESAEKPEVEGLETRDDPPDQQADDQEHGRHHSFVAGGQRHALAVLTKEAHRGQVEGVHGPHGKREWVEGSLQNRGPKLQARKAGQEQPSQIPVGAVEALGGKVDLNGFTGDLWHVEPTTIRRRLQLERNDHEREEE